MTEQQLRTLYMLQEAGSFAQLAKDAGASAAQLAFLQAAHDAWPDFSS